jgi:hypothetical protein
MSEPPARERIAPSDAHARDLAQEPLRPEDFYMDGPYLVFTEGYHLRRGYCCNSDCRHCPYKEFG